MSSDEPKTLPLLDLPPELFERILVHLSPADIFACAATCKLLHAAVAHSPLLQYHIELETAGLEEGQGRADGVQDRLRALRIYKKRWETLDWRLETRAPFWDSGNIWDLCGGVFGQGNVGTRGRSFHFTRLPSKVLGLEDAHSWEFPNINVDGGVRDFSFDPPQNLLVLLDMKSWPLTVHLRTLTTNEAHPLAAKPAFEYLREDAQAQSSDVVDESFYLQIMGDLVAILRLPRAADRIPLHRLNEIVFFNWKTGKLVTTLMLSDLAILTFSFISHCHFVVGVGEDNSPPDAPFPLPTNPRLKVYRFDPTTLGPPVLTCTLLMPELHDAFRIGYLLTRSDPAPGAPVPPQRPFGPSPQDRILVTTLTIRHGRTMGIEEVVNFFVHMSTLLDFSTPLEREGLSIDIPWELWAHRARVIPTRFEPTWVCYVHGMRYIVAIGIQPGRDDLVQACVFDFNQLGLRKAKHELENKISDPVETVEVITIEEEQDENADADGDGDANDEEWEDDKQAQVRIISVPTMHHSEAFKKPIVSGLPFRRMVSPVHIPCTALMLDDDNIVCVKEDTPRRLVFLSL